MKVDLKAAKNNIEELEYFANGFQRLSGASVKVTNVRVKGESIVANVTLIIDDKKTMYKGCTYPMDIMKRHSHG